MKRIISCTLFLFLFAISSTGQDTLWQRKYDFNFYNNYDLRNSSTNAIGTYRLVSDGIELLVDSNMKPKAGAITKSVLNFATIYLSMLWSHEFGHSIRAEQVGGKFKIHNFGVPVPYTTVDLPADISLINEAAFVTAGFEVNYTNIRNIQSDFLRYNGIWNEDLAFSFANRLMYPVYTLLIVPIDPSDPQVWIKTAGDPVHYILPVFKNHTDNQVFLEDGSVNPDLAKLYNQANILAQAFNFLDPQFYREIGAAFGRASKIRKPIFLIGDHHTGWTYGTLFNASPLGYELYMQNYLHIQDRQFGFYFKYGRPFRNNGLGLSMNDVFNTESISTDMSIEVWDQDIFGSGLSFETESNYRVNQNFGLNLILGYKTEGYVLGKQLSEGLIFGLGISIFNNTK